MHDKLKKIMQKKRDLSDNERDAKMDVVKQLRDMASSAMGDKIDGLRKVSVTSNSPEGLEEGLNKAREVVSGKELEQMKDHAENDMGDYKSALEEHSDDEDNEEEGFDNDDNHYSEGGQVDLKQSAQDSMRKAFGYDEGGEVEESDESPEEEALESGSEEHENLEGLDLDEIKRRIQHLMNLHEQMSAKKS